MRKFLLTPALISLSALAASAAIITTPVDTFNSTLQFVRSPNASPCGGPDSNTVAAPEALGGQRTITAGGNVSGCAQADTNFTEAGAYSANLPGTQTGTFTVIWNAGNFDADLLSGFFILAKQDADTSLANASTVQFRACTAADGGSGCSDSTIASITSTLYQNYGVSFSSVLNDINYIRMTVIGGPGRDVFVDYISAPEPGTFLMAGGALALLAALRARR